MVVSFFEALSQRERVRLPNLHRLRFVFCPCDYHVILRYCVSLIFSVQFSVTVSYSVEVKDAKLEIMEKEQNVATKTVKFVPFGISLLECTLLYSCLLLDTASTSQTHLLSP